MTIAELQTYLVYREPKGRYKHVMRNMFVFVSAQSAAQAIRVAKKDLLTDSDYSAAKAIFVDTSVKIFYI